MTNEQVVSKDWNYDHVLRAHAKPGRIAMKSVKAPQ